MSKMVPIKIPARPSTGDEWVEAAVKDPAKLKAVEKIKRFTVDIPESMHRRIKTQCATRGVLMSEYVRDILERELSASQ